MSKDCEAYLDLDEREGQTIRTHTGWRLIRQILKYGRWVFLGGLAILMGTFAALAEPRIFGYAIDEAIVPRKWDLLTRFSLIFFCVILMRMFSTICQAYCFEVLGQKVTQDLRCQLFSQIQRLSLSDLDRNPAGRLLTRVTHDVGAIVEMFSGGMISLFSNTLMVVGILAWLLILDFKLGLIAASVFPILVAASVYFSVKLKISYREARSKLSALNAFLAENLLGIRVVQLFNRRSLHLSRFERLNQGYSDAQIATIRVFAVFQPTITIFAGISVALVIWFGGQAARVGEIKVGVLFAYFSYVLSLFQPVRELADKWNVVLSGLASAERIFSVLDWPVELDEQESRGPSRPLDHLKGHIVFENVWFAYEGEQWILKDFSMEILPGQKVGVVGHSGAGKSTLIALLMRFYEPQKGRILIDGQELCKYDRRTLRASIGIIQQDVFLFSGSFQENITFWGSMPPDHGDLLEFNLERLLDQKRSLNEKGSNLSMGERQVLAFARAKAANPRIWILDEATANMDSDTEILTQRSLDAASSGKTVILIAHRLSTVKSADQILVLHKGTLVERGTHRELIELNGLYARLYRVQKSEEEVQSSHPRVVSEDASEIKLEGSIQDV